MGAIGSAIGGVLGGLIPWFKKGGKVKKYANGGLINLDAQDKSALTTLAKLAGFKKGGKVRKSKARK